MCDILTKILDKKEAWTLIGVVVGAFIGVIIKWIGNIFYRKRIKKALRNELERNLYISESKIDNIRHIIENLQSKKILSGNSVHSVSSVYVKYLSLLSVYLKQNEIDNLHIIYERLRNHDKVMDEFESLIIKDIDMKLVKDPWLKYENIFNDIIDSYKLVQSLIKDLLKNEPKDIFAKEKTLIK